MSPRLPLLLRQAEKLAVLDFYGHVLALYDDTELVVPWAFVVVLGLLICELGWVWWMKGKLPGLKF